MKLRLPTVARLVVLLRHLINYQSNIFIETIYRWSDLKCHVTVLNRCVPRLASFYDGVLLAEPENQFFTFGTLFTSPIRALEIIKC